MGIAPQRPVGVATDAPASRVLRRKQADDAYANISSSTIMAEAGAPLRPPQEVASAIVATGTEDPAFPFPLPRVTIRFCTQCKWMLRAAYFAQELLSTFSTSLGEVALQPSTGGTFVVTIQHSTPPTTTDTPPEATIQTKTLWDRKVDGGFPETKELKRRVRDVIEPGRNLGHVDRDHKKEKESPSSTEQTGTNMSELQQGNASGPSGPRYPTSVSALQAQSQDSQPSQQQEEGNPDPPRRGHSRPMMPAVDNPDPVRKGHSQPMIPADSGPAAPNSRSWEDLPPHSSAQGGQEQGGDVYKPKMAGGGSMPVVKPPGEARNAEVKAKIDEANRRKEECEDCQ
ncbi:selenoprotein domain-containing protein [Seiridium cupressi]